MRDGKTVLCEVGVGPLSMAYSALVWGRDDMEVLAFEPHPAYFKDLQEAAKDRPNVRLYNVAIGDENGEMDFYDEGTSSALAGVASPSVQHYKRAGLPAIKVQVRKISEFDDGSIDILRVDTEGAEWFCIRHLVSRPKQIVIEMYNDLATYINPHLYEIESWTARNNYVKAGIQDGDFIYQLKPFNK